MTVSNILQMLSQLVQGFVPLSGSENQFADFKFGFQLAASRHRQVMADS
jgi:hypothetical protein